MLTVHRRVRPVAGEGLVAPDHILVPRVVKRQEADAARAVRAIGRVHSMPRELPETRVETADLPPGVQGRAFRQVGLIQVASAAEHPDLVVRHEVGHVLADVVDDMPQAAGLLAEVMRGQSMPAMRTRRCLGSSHSTRRTGRELRRALGANEQFAMAYMTWVAWHSRQRLLLDRIAGIQDVGDIESLRVWGMKDFLPMCRSRLPWTT